MRNRQRFLLYSSIGVFAFLGAQSAGAAQSAPQMTAAANAFVATLNEEQRDSVVQPMLNDERTVWSNLPISMVRPDGLLIGSDAGSAPNGCAPGQKKSAFLVKVGLPNAVPMG